MNTKGSPWAVRWFFVKPTTFYVSARASDESLNKKQVFYGTGDQAPSNTPNENLLMATNNTSFAPAIAAHQALLPTPSSALKVSKRANYSDTIMMSLLALTIGVLVGRNLQVARR
jgi:hypothetical protein